MRAPSIALQYCGVIASYVVGGGLAVLACQPLDTIKVMTKYAIEIETGLESFGCVDAGEDADVSAVLHWCFGLRNQNMETSGDYGAVRGDSSVLGSKYSGECLVVHVLWCMSGLSTGKLQGWGGPWALVEEM